MAHAAKVNPETKLVEDVIVIPAEHQHRAQEYLNNDCNISGWWIQTSFNTRGGVNNTGGTALRKNFAGPGYTYDEGRDAFIPPKPFESWNLDEDTCLWIPPVPYPTDGIMYEWSEDDLDWVAVIN